MTRELIEEGNEKKKILQKICEKKYFFFSLLQKNEKTPINLVLKNSSTIEINFQNLLASFLQKQKRKLLIIFLYLYY